MEVISVLSSETDIASSDTTHRSGPRTLDCGCHRYFQLLLEQFHITAHKKGPLLQGGPSRLRLHRRTRFPILEDLCEVVPL